MEKMHMGKKGRFQWSSYRFAVGFLWRSWQCHLAGFAFVALYFIYGRVVRILLESLRMVAFFLRLK
jgi:hypothetical protein